MAFGENAQDQCGNSYVRPNSRLNRNEDGERFKFVGAAAGARHTVLLREDGAAVAFRYNEEGQCDIPVLQDKKEKFIAAACGRSHTILVTNEGDAYSCGKDSYGQSNIPDLLLGEDETPWSDEEEEKAEEEKAEE